MSYSAYPASYALPSAQGQHVAVGVDPRSFIQATGVLQAGTNGFPLPIAVHTPEHGHAQAAMAAGLAWPPPQEALAMPTAAVAAPQMHIPQAAGPAAIHMPGTAVYVPHYHTPTAMGAVAIDAMGHAIVDPSHLSGYAAVPYHMAHGIIPVSSSLGAIPATLATTHVMPSRPAAIATTTSSNAPVSTATVTQAVSSIRESPRIVAIADQTAPSGLPHSVPLMKEHLSQSEQRDRHKEIEKWREGVNAASQGSTSPPLDPSGILVRDKNNAASAVSNDAVVAKSGSAGMVASSSSGRSRKRQHPDNISPGHEQPKPKVERRRAEHSAPEVFSHLNHLTAAVPVCQSSDSANAEHSSAQQVPVFTMPVLPQVPGIPAASSLPGLVPVTAASLKTADSKSRGSGSTKPKGPEKIPRVEKLSPHSTIPVEPVSERNVHMYSQPTGSIVAGTAIAAPGDVYSHSTHKTSHRDDEKSKKKLRGSVEVVEPPVERRTDSQNKRAPPPASHHRPPVGERESREFIPPEAPRLGTAEVSPEGAVVASDGLTPVIGFPRGMPSLTQPIIYSPYVMPYMAPPPTSVANGRSAPTTTVFSVSGSQPHASAQRPSSHHEQDPPPMEPTGRGGRQDRKKRSQETKRPLSSDDKESHALPPVAFPVAVATSSAPPLQLLTSVANMATNNALHQYSEQVLTASGQHGPATHPSAGHDKPSAHGHSRVQESANVVPSTDIPHEATATGGRDRKMFIYKPTTRFSEGGEAEVKLVQENVNPQKKTPGTKRSSKKHPAGVPVESSADGHSSSTSNIHMKAMASGGTAVSPPSSSHKLDRSPPLATLPALASIASSGEASSKAPTTAPHTTSTPTVTAAGSPPVASAAEGSLPGALPPGAIAMASGAANPYLAYGNWVPAGWEHVQPQQMAAYHAQQFVVMQHMAYQQQQLVQQQQQSQSQSQSSKPDHQHEQQRAAHSKSHPPSAPPSGHTHPQKHQPHEAAAPSVPTKQQQPAKSSQPVSSGHGNSQPAAYSVSWMTEKKSSDGSRRSNVVQHKEVSRGSQGGSRHSTNDSKSTGGADSWIKMCPPAVQTSHLPTSAADSHTAAIPTSLVLSGRKDGDGKVFATERGGLQKGSSQTSLYSHHTDLSQSTSKAESKHPPRMAAPSAHDAPSPVPPLHNGSEQHAPPKEASSARAISGSGKSKHRHSQRASGAPGDLGSNLVITGGHTGRDAYTVEGTAAMVHGTWPHSSYYAASLTGVDWARLDQLIADVSHMEGMTEDMKEQTMSNLVLQQIHFAASDPNDILGHLTKMYTQLYANYNRLREELEGTPDASEEVQQRLQSELHKCLADLQQKQQTYAEYMNARYTAFMAHYKNTRETQAKRSETKGEKPAGAEKATGRKVSSEGHEHYGAAVGSHHKDREEKAHAKKETSSHTSTSHDKKALMLVDSKHPSRKNEYGYVVAGHQVQQPMSIAGSILPGGSQFVAAPPNSIANQWTPAIAGLVAASAEQVSTATVILPTTAVKTVPSPSSSKPSVADGSSVSPPMAASQDNGSSRPIPPIASVVNGPPWAQVGPMPAPPGKALLPLHEQKPTPHRADRPASKGSSHEVDVSVLAGAQALVGLACGGRFTPGGAESVQPSSSAHTSFHVNDILPEPADPEQHFIRSLGQRPYKQTKVPEAVPRQDGKKSSPKSSVRAQSPCVPMPGPRGGSPANSNSDIDVVHSDGSRSPDVNESVVEGSEDDEPEACPRPLKINVSPRKQPLEFTVNQLKPQPLSLEQRATDAAICLTSLRQQAPDHHEHSRNSHNTADAHRQERTLRRSPADSCHLSELNNSRIPRVPPLLNGKDTVQASEKDDIEKEVQVRKELAEAKRYCEKKEQELARLQREKSVCSDAVDSKASKKWQGGRRGKRKSPDDDLPDRSPKKLHSEGLAAEEPIGPTPSKRPKVTMLVETQINPEKRMRRPGRPKRDHHTQVSHFGKTKKSPSNSKSHSQVHDVLVKGKHNKRSPRGASLSDAAALSAVGHAQASMHAEEDLAAMQKDLHKASIKQHHELKELSPSKKQHRKHKKIKSKERKLKHSSHSRELHGDRGKAAANSQLDDNEHKVHHPVDEGKHSRRLMLAKSPDNARTSRRQSEADNEDLSPVYNTAPSLSKETTVIEPAAVAYPSPDLSSVQAPAMDVKANTPPVAKPKNPSKNSTMTPAPESLSPVPGSAGAVQNKEVSSPVETPQLGDAKEKLSVLTSNNPSPAASPTVSSCHENAASDNSLAAEETAAPANILTTEECEERKSVEKVEEKEVNDLDEKEGNNLDESQEKEQAPHGQHGIASGEEDDEGEETGVEDGDEGNTDEDDDTAEGGGQLVIDCPSNEQEEQAMPHKASESSPPVSPSLEQRIDDLGVDVRPLWNRPAASPVPKRVAAAKSGRLPYQPEVEDISSPDSTDNAPLTIDEDASPLGDSCTPVDERADSNLAIPMDVDKAATTLL